MSATDHSSVLLEAFALPQAQALAKWTRWRETLDLHNMDAAYLAILPMLSHRLEEWLVDDAARASIQGICKRAWAHNQLAFRSLATIAGALREEGVGRIILTEASAWALLYAERKAIRPIDSIEILVARREASRAVSALTCRGWRLLPDFPNPEGDALDYFEGVWLVNARDERLKLGWRLLPCPPELAASRETPGPLIAIEVQGVDLHALAPEEMLLHALAGHREPCQVDWRWDAIALLDARRLDWVRMNQLLHVESFARGRLRELHENWPVSIPEDVLESKTGWFRRRLDAVWRDYQWHAWRAGRPPTWRGFAAYCPKRWWKVFVTDRVA